MKKCSSSAQRICRKVDKIQQKFVKQNKLSFFFSVLLQLGKNKKLIAKTERKVGKNKVQIEEKKTEQEEQEKQENDGEI